ncbi:hypothetical protein RJ55_04963 [Drechmeria coniospora]|nr:hypothetical protein RJ55_04963 [Drechmeria coniospora]
MAATTMVPDTAEQEPPPLSYEIVSSDDDKRDALKLVADSIAQQRQLASLAVIFHPVCFVALVAACVAAWRHSAHDLGTAVISTSGLVIAYLAAVRMLTSPYISLAEEFRWREFIAGPDGGDDDLVLAARFGDDVIATLVLRLEPAAPTGTRSQKGSPAARGGLIRAWTTKLRYRTKGVGADMLRFAVATTQSACADDEARLTFDPHHANSAMPLHGTFNRPFRSRDEKARKALAHALADCRRSRTAE